MTLLASRTWSALHHWSQQKELNENQVLPRNTEELDELLSLSY